LLLIFCVVSKILVNDLEILLLLLFVQVIGCWYFLDKLFFLFDNDLEWDFVLITKFNDGVTDLLLENKFSGI
jgi:hypothetical protein